MDDEKDDGRRKVKTFLHGKWPALCYAGKNQLVKKAAQESDMHKKQADRARETIDDGRVTREIVNKKGRGGDQKIHGINTRHAVFEVLFEPVFGQVKIIVIAKRNEEAGEHEEYGYPDVKL